MQKSCAFILNVLFVWSAWQASSKMHGEDVRPTTCGAINARLADVPSYMMRRHAYMDLLFRHSLFLVGPYLMCCEGGSKTLKQTLIGFRVFVSSAILYIGRRSISAEKTCK